MNDQLEAYKFAADLTKQILTLSTGVVTISIGIANLGKQLSASAKNALLALGVASIFSVVFGLLTLMAIAGRIGTQSNEGIYGSGIAFFAGLQQLSFVVGLGLVVRYGVKLASTWRAEPQTPGKPEAQPSVDTEAPTAVEPGENID